MTNKLDLVKQFNKIWSFKKSENDEIPEEEYMGYMDQANILMVVPKLKSIKDFIKDNFDAEEKEVPKLDYMMVFSKHNLDKLLVSARLEGIKEGAVENSVKLSAEYMKLILNLCTKTKSTSILFKYKKDYPLWAETEELIIILAPRVKN